MVDERKMEKDMDTEQGVKKSGLVFLLCCFVHDVTRDFDFSDSVFSPVK